MLKSIVAGLIVCLGLGVTVASACDVHALKISDATVKLPPPNAHHAAAYMTINNPTDSKMIIVGAKTDRADITEIHETKITDGVASMQKVGTLVLEPKQTVALTPGGLHVMLMGIKQPIKAGENIPVTLEFADGTTLVVPAVVK